MKRRQFLSLIAGAAATPLAAHAQPAGKPTIGYLHSGAPEQNAKRLAAFLKGLGEEGFIDGQNVTIEYRWASGQNEKLPAMAADLVQRKVSLIATLGSSPATLVAKKATQTIPIVMAIGTDPVALGLVQSISRPGGNIAGITSVNAELAAKRLGVLRELVPQAANYFTIVNQSSALTEPFVKELQAAATTLGIQIKTQHASNDRELDAAFGQIPKQPGNVLVFPPDSFYYIRRERIAVLSAQHAVPAIFDVRDYVDAGGLISYGGDFLNVMQLAGVYAARILKGERPADLPVQQTAKFEMVINLKAAKALGIEVPPKLLFTADDVIE